MMPGNTPENNQKPNSLPENEHAGIAEFPRLNVMLFVMLTLITFGIYMVYWMYNRTMIVNRQVGSEGIPMAFISLAVTAFVVCIGFDIALRQEPTRMDLMLVYLVFALICNILFLVWIFKIRNRLHLMMQISKDHPYWCKTIWTFLFLAFYIQYKINQTLDDETNKLANRYTRNL